jgi:orotate phosphoribosyltransferase
MNDPEIMQKFIAVGAIVTDSHFVYTSGRHGPVYINKDALYVHPEIISVLCQRMAQSYDPNTIDVVVAPVLGGIILSQWVAHALNQHRNNANISPSTPRNDVNMPSSDPRRDVGLSPSARNQSPTETLAVFAEKSTDTPDKHFHFTRGYDKYIPNKNILVVEDVLATGSSIRQVIELIRQHNGHVIGVSALCNRGNVQPPDIGNVPINALINIDLQTYPAEECPLCASHVPINTELGKGQAFLAKKA